MKQSVEFSPFSDLPVLHYRWVEDGAPFGLCEYPWVGSPQGYRVSDIEPGTDGRTFTLTDGYGVSKVYKGFNCRFSPAEMDLIAVVLAEGEIETYVLDDTEQALTELSRYLADRGSWISTIVGVYRRQ